MSAFEWSQLDPQCRVQFIPHEVGLMIHLPKTNVRGTREVQALVKRESLRESMLIDCLAKVAAMAEYDDGENLFFSRRSVDGTEKKRLVSKTISTMVKECSARTFQYQANLEYEGTWGF